MSRSRAGALLALFVVASGCGSQTSRGGASGAEYVNEDLGLSFRVPAGWSRASGWSGIGKSGFVTAFAAPAGEPIVTVARASFAGIDCGAASREALKEVTGASMATIAEMEVGMASRRIPAGQGATAVGDRQGEARYFCHDKTTVVVEASSPRAVFEAHRAEIHALLDSVSYVEAGGQAYSLRMPEMPRAARVFTHVVRYKGETMAAIVEWYTGSVDNWRAVAQLNADVTSPNAPLKIGREVKLPGELVTRQDPLPRPKLKPPGRKSKPEKAGAKTGSGDSKPASDAPSGDDEAPLPALIGPR